jgi:acid stress-induced BolA-like protein IbaG/YrbA
MPLNTLSLPDQVRARIETAFPGADVQVTGSGGHFQIRVVSERFEGLNTLKKQRLVYAAFKDMMAGDAAPVHAVDSMITLTPGQAG